MGKRWIGYRTSIPTANGTAVGIENFVLLSMGTGVGCGIVVNNELFRGSSGSAGELGFAPISPGNRIAPLRPASPDRATGILEESLGAAGIVARAQGLGLRQIGDARSVFALAESGNAKAKQLVSEVAELLGRAIVTVVSLFDPEMIVVAGGIGGSLEQLRPATEEAVARLSPFKPTIVAGSLGDASVLHGGIALGLPIARDRMFANRKAVHA
jgi:predicted NBD/HSP70 family sugar kinase